MRVFPPLLVLAAALAGCRGSAEPRPVTAADSLAVRLAEAHGGYRAFAAMDVVRFDWQVERDSAPPFVRHHLWDRAGDRVRVEWTEGGDSTYVAAFSPSRVAAGLPDGGVALNGTPLEGEARTERLEQAYRAHVNDTYWWLAPMKAMDPGVRREVVTDSLGTALALSFEGVGLTPGDRYWIETDPATGAITGWRYRLEGDTTLGRWAWTDPVPIPTPVGPVTLPAVKTNLDSGARIVTRPRPIPTGPDVWSTLTPILQP